MNFNDRQPFIVVLGNGATFTVSVPYRIANSTVTGDKSIQFFDPNRNTTFVIPLKNIAFMSQPQT